MEIIKSLIHSIVRFVVINIVVILFSLTAPLIYALPIALVAIGDKSLSSSLIELEMLTGPFVCCFWMILICHWHTVRRAQREGRLVTWRQDEGGLSHTLAKSIGFMFIGFFGSALAEFVFMAVKYYGFNSLVNHNYFARLTFVAMAPFAVFAPVWLVLLRRWMRGRKQWDYISRAKGDRELRETLHAISLQAKSMRSQNAHLREAWRGEEE
ncbi:MAG: hypothetical protein WB781_24660 [Candidatus Sulfotelmatobacter sp.]